MGNFQVFGNRTGMKRDMGGNWVDVGSMAHGGKLPDHSHRAGEDKVLVGWSNLLVLQNHGGRVHPCQAVEVQLVALSLEQ